MFPRNESNLDRGARVVVGGGLLACAVRGRGLMHVRSLRALSGLVGVVLLATAATGSCPLYRALGIDTAN